MKNGSAPSRSESPARQDERAALAALAADAIPGLRQVALAVLGSAGTVESIFGDPFDTALTAQVLKQAAGRPAGQATHMSVGDRMILSVRLGASERIVIAGIDKAQAPPVGRLTRTFLTFAGLLAGSHATEGAIDTVSRDLLAGLAAIGGRKGRARHFAMLDLVRRLLNSNARLLLLRKGRVERVISDENRNAPRNRSLRIFAEQGLREGETLLSASLESEGNLGVEGPLFCQKFGLRNFAIGLPAVQADEGIGLYLADATPEAASALPRFVEMLNLGAGQSGRSRAAWAQWAAAAAIPLALLVWLMLPADFEITAEGRAIPARSVTVASLLEARLDQRLVAIGDRVSAGDPLVRLESEQLSAEEAQAELDHLLAELNAREARASGSYAEYQIAERKADLSEARLAQVRERLTWLSAAAPEAGKVIDLVPQNRVGDIVARGERLAEIQLGEEMRVEIDLAQEDVRFVQPGQTGRFVVRGLIDGEFAVTVTEPAFTYADEKAKALKFQTTADVGSAGGSTLANGMSGIVRLSAGRRRNVEIMGRYLMDWLRLTAWKQLGLRL